MTDREVMQQALEALEEAKNGSQKTPTESVINALRTPPQQQAEALQAMNDQLTTGISIMLDGKRVDPASVYKQAEPVAWDVFELRLYGAPQEKQHRVLWVDRYIYPDGSTPDLDGLLDAAKEEGGIDGGAKTLHVRPLYTTPPQRQWVGLTDEDINRESAPIAQQMKLAFHAGMYVAQEILKEKNGLHKD